MLIAILGGLAGGLLMWWWRNRRRGEHFTPEQMRRIEQIKRERDTRRSTMRDV